jgi:hypothetical protein
MENVKIRCKVCNKELEGHPVKTVTCGCPNMATIRGGVITALDLSQIVMLSSTRTNTSTGVLTYEDMQWQEERRKRKVRKLDFEVR